MNRAATIRPPICEADLAHAIAEWVQRAPREVLLNLADSDSREEAAAALGELIVARMTMVLPEHVDSVQPPLPL